MTGYIARRLLHGLFLVAGVVVVNFVLLRLAPGDTATAIAGEMGGATADVLAAIRADYGLDRPLPTQLAIYLGHIARGDLGMSHYFNLPVSSLIAARLGPTVLLVASAQIVALVVGVALGVLAARARGGAVPTLVTAFTTACHAMPVFWTGIMLVVLFASILPVLPVEGMSDLRLRDAGWITRTLDVARHLVLPVVTLVLVHLAQYARITGAAMREVLAADFIRVVRAKGAPERTVLFRHALRNAALPVLTVAGLQFGHLLSGALLVETVFNWPGLGRLAFESLLRRDYPTVLGVLLCAAAMVVVVNLLTDLAYRLADPRLRTVP